MKILSISAQKPNSTGSGVYLTELVKSLAIQGYEQAVIAGVYKDDETNFPEGVAFHPVYFCTEKIPYPIVGMSDEMPYISTRYCDMTEEMVEQFKEGFLEVLVPVVEEFKPDLILTHHLYLLTAIVREKFPDCTVYGFCHNTDLRQMMKTDLEREFIAGAVRKLDKIFVPQTAQQKGVLKVYDAVPEKITILGMGYNSEIFQVTGEKPDDGITSIIFAGKIAEKKGVMSLIRSLEYLPFENKELKIMLAGGAGNEIEYRQIHRMANNCKYDIEFLGRLPQVELAKYYNMSDIFVLPSFFEGLPLTVIEALACGDRVVMTNLPGIPQWLSENAFDADIRYVDLPGMVNADEPLEEELPAFEKRLADTLCESIRNPHKKNADTSRISWENIAKEVLK
ncbi:MAG: glycosyltransferase family 4 protein [Dorea sp.]